MIRPAAAAALSFAGFATTRSAVAVRNTGDVFIACAELELEKAAKRAKRKC